MNCWVILDRLRRYYGFFLKENIKKFYTKIGGDPDSTLPFFFSRKFLIEGNALVNSMRYAHELIKQSNMEKQMNDRAGASCLAAALAENIMTLALLLPMRN